MPLVLNMSEFWVWQDSQYASVTQHSEYARIRLDRVLNISWVLNMPGTWIWQDSEYLSVSIFKFPTEQCYNYWWAWSSILKVLKVTNLLYLKNISKKKLAINFFNKNMINKILHLIKYFSVATAIVFCCDAKHSAILWGSSHVCYYLLIHYSAFL